MFECLVIEEALLKTPYMVRELFISAVAFSANMEDKRILIISPELTYYDVGSSRQEVKKVGGLADLVATLVDTLRGKGLSPYVAVPHFWDSGLSKEECEAERLFLVEDSRYSYLRTPYERQVEEFSLAFQSQVINELIPRIRPDIIHAHDWPTGLIAPLLGPYYNTLFSIHNIHTKTEHIDTIESMGLPNANKERVWLQHFDWGRVDFLMSGIFGSDYCVTPSQRWLDEILEGDIPPNAPPGFSDLMQQKKGTIFGILNSPDDSYDPEKDSLIYSRFTIEDMVSGKRANKAAFQVEVGLGSDDQSTLVVFTSRADPYQKGIDLLDLVVPKLIIDNPQLQVAIVSDGPYIPRVDHTISWLESQGYHGRVVAKPFSDVLERRAYAAADGVLTFSSYSPCELVQMKGALYGAIPLGMAKGGVAQTVHDFRVEDEASVPGILTRDYTAEAMEQVFRSFLEVADSDSLDKLSRQTMEVATRMFTPEKMADSYLEIYRKMSP
jgi:starch synthase